MMNVKTQDLTLLLLLLVPWLLVLESAAFAQESSVRGLNLGAAYAQFINITLSEDLSAANYQLDATEGVSDPRLVVARVPWRFASTRWERATIDWELLFGYLNLQAGFPVTVSGVGNGNMDSDWTTYGVMLGALIRIPLTATFSIEPAVRLGGAMLRNDTSYSGSAELFKPFTEGILFNWTTNAWIASPSLSLSYHQTWGGVETLLTGHAVHSRVVSFHESNEEIAFRKGANTVSLKGELEMPTGWSEASRDLRWVGIAGYAKFFGENSDVMGFNDVFEVGAGLSLSPSSSAGHDARFRLSASLLRGHGVRGWTVGLGLRTW